MTNLPHFTGANLSYHEFLEKMVNALDQARPGFGKLIRNVCRHAGATTRSTFSETDFEGGQRTTTGGLNVTIEEDDGTMSKAAAMYPDFTPEAGQILFAVISKIARQLPSCGTVKKTILV